MTKSSTTASNDVLLIDFVKDFSRAPSGRFRSDGKFSGEVFREDYLVPALESRKRLKIIFDGARNPGSSFLDEAFGGLTRLGNFQSSELHKRIEIISRRQSISKEIWDYIDNPLP